MEILILLYVCKQRAARREDPLRDLKEDWLRGVDSNHDSQIQSLESYQLDDPGVAARSLAEGNSG